MILIFRRPRESWVWRHGSGLRPIHQKELVELLKPAQGGIIPGGIYMDVERRKADTLELLKSGVAPDWHTPFRVTCAIVSGL